MTPGRRTALAGLLAPLLAISACSSEPEQEKKPAPKSNPCHQLLGDQGIKWLESRTDGAELNMNASNDIAGKREFIQEQILDWRPGDLANFGGGTACGVGERPKKDPAEELQLSFSPSSRPFDYDFTKPDSNGQKARAVSASPEVKLVYGPHLLRPDVTVYRVYIQCGVKGAAEGQLNEVPLQGSLEDTLTGDPSHRTHFKHLLHSAKVMTDGFGCTNKPQIPTTVPASVKD